jgi:hypothetical protein
VKILVEIDGNQLVEWLRQKESAAVIDTGETFLITAPIGDILDGAVENMRVVFDGD